MNRKSEGTSESRFASYVLGLSSVLGHADRIGPLRDYCTGLILPGERKSVEPGCEDGSGTDGGAAPVVAAFCRCRVVVR